VSINSRKGSSP